jgi:DNA modification methylase
VCLILSAFEDIPVRDLPKVDIAFTSTPYFGKEIYDESEEGKSRQSRERYPTYNEWRRRFLSPLISHSIQCLRKHGSLALNIANVLIKSIRYPLIKDTIKIADNCGFSLVKRLELFFPAYGKGLKHKRIEPILIFRRT